MDYHKYYNLEEYLFSEVTNNFEKRGYLKPDEFFCVIIWKANRAKGKIKAKLLDSHIGNLEEIVKKLTQEIKLEKDQVKKMSLLLHKWKFPLPMASAILTVLYPSIYTVYDIRVCSQLNMEKIYGSGRYFKEFLPKVKKYKTGNTLREKDKYLWGKSFYEDLCKLIM